MRGSWCKARKRREAPPPLRRSARFFFGGAFCGRDRFQPLVDQSNLLQTDRAILLGRLEKPWAAVQVALSGESSESAALEVQQYMDRVWCRIAIPVEPAPKK